MPSIYDWSKTAANNANSDAAINWAEGMPPADVNDSGRAMMARAAEFVKDITGALVAAGTANGVVITANSPFTTLTNGRMVVFRANALSTGAVTLNVNSLGAKKLMRFTSSGAVQIVAGGLRQGQVVLAVYNTTLDGGAGAWVMANAPDDAADKVAKDGDTMTGGLTLPASTSDISPIVIPHGSAPSSSANGSIWTTTAGIFARISGATVQLLITARQVLAGDGLIGGGVLNIDRTLALGTPSSISNTTTNNVTTTSHTHALSFMAAEVYTGSTQDETSYPIGASLIITASTSAARNAVVLVYLGSENYRFRDTGTTALSGTWRSRGYTPSADIMLVQRTA